MTGRRPDIALVARGLAGHIQSLAAELFPHGHEDRRAGQWCVGSLAGEPGQSLRIELRGERRGLWIDHADRSLGGDALDLVAQALFNGSRADAWRWGCDWLGLGEADDAAARPVRRPPPPTPSEPEETPEAKRQRAFGRWLSAQQKIAGTPVEAYLAGRGIDLQRLGRQPGALRYHPELFTDGRHWPAMVALIQDGAGRPIGCHRTFLARDDAGRWGKAPVGQNGRKVLGLTLGGIIPLWRGASGRALRDAPDGDHAVLVEGIEDGLTIALAAPEFRVIACISIGNLAQLVLPPAIRTVTIAGDNDPETITVRGVERPHPARSALLAAIDRFQAEGRRVLLAYAGGGAKDFNARLQGAA